MTTKTEANNVAKKVQSLAMGLIGAMFIALGFSYFTEQASYRIPRILLPVYELMGNIGLAIGLLILGLSLLYTAYSKFKNSGGNPSFMWIILPIFVASAFVITHIFEKKNTEPHTRVGGTIQNKSESDLHTNIIRPKLEHTEANAYLDRVETIVQEMTTAREEKNDKNFGELEIEYFELTKQLADIIPPLSKTDKYADFAKYNAQLANKINKMRGI
ncbi:hypothetical protein [Sphingobacterium faecale]|uniref:Uncharacterized protein n=1 Tax=Sphingobacterium faecale TaxID=2803775 RepID=A0ABS1R692_9SPHI|nr:hypothetical protein [Sphingobacterium faecale]MBL1409391.1 hypothetical protein [Sphingobacterium faecale]